MNADWIDRQEYPFASHYFEVPAGRLHYVDEGSGEPIVMVHGNPTWSFLYRKLIKRLRPEYRCIAPDHEAFGSPDFWQHPADFEVTRRGDCEDHALWAWRKLAELGIAAEFVVGCKLVGEGAWEGHAWVHLWPATDCLVLDASAKGRDSMISPQAAIAPYLRPHFAVDHAFTRHTFQGWLLTVQERQRSGRPE